MREAVSAPEFFELDDICFDFSNRITVRKDPSYLHEKREKKL